MADLSFKALSFCSQLVHQQDVYKTRQKSLSMMLDLTQAETGMILAFDATGQSLVTLASSHVHMEPIFMDQQDPWSFQSLTSLFSLKQCRWEESVDILWTETRHILFKEYSFGRILAVPGRSQTDGYADILFIILVPSNIRPTYRSFQILFNFGSFCAALFKKDIKQHTILQSEVRAPKSRTMNPSSGIIGSSPVMNDLRKNIERFAPSALSVLITGETGTGKEMVARAIHKQSHYRKGSFVAVNTTTLPSSLIESELFGHIKGSFTGADKDHEGLVLKANGGTLFLDEIGDLPYELQAKLLRVIQEHKFRPVGGQDELQSDFRLVTATHRNLEAMIEENEFREDLFYRLNQVPIHIPPLRERGQDILDLSEFFIRAYCEKTGQTVKMLLPETRRRLMDLSLPGNVRELQALIERAVTLAGESSLIHPDHIAVQNRSRIPSVHIPEGLSLSEACKAYECSILTQTYQSLKGNKKEMAKKLSLPLRTLSHKLNRFGLE